VQAVPYWPSLRPESLHATFNMFLEPFHSVFAYYSPVGMHYCQHGKVNPTTYVVTCKRCARTIPAATQEFPRINLVVQLHALWRASPVSPI
jgi:hypothetical protein